MHAVWRNLGGTPLDEIRMTAAPKKAADVAPPSGSNAAPASKPGDQRIEPAAKPAVRPRPIERPAEPTPTQAVKPSTPIVSQPPPSYSGRGVTHTKPQASTEATPPVVAAPKRPAARVPVRAVPPAAACTDAVAALGLCAAAPTESGK